MKEKIISDRLLRQKTATAFLVFFLSFAAGIFFWLWLKQQPKEAGAGIAYPLRKGLGINENIFSAAFNANRLVKTYPVSEAVKKVRVNGNIGMSGIIKAEGWKLSVVKNSGDTVFFTLDDVLKLPKTEIVYDFKCIEGWSQKTWWGGVRFSDFIKQNNLEAELQHNYVGLITPDGEYYVGIDMPSMMQPQTLLCYEMNGKPLPANQGYPLRLIIPVKYGIKSIKRIGSIYFSNNRPKDYWAERGYDYYAGH
jgi:DMSO/TMAO reductase YedYZ molybdopterin-dependent catalytic subunit